MIGLIVLALTGCSSDDDQDCTARGALSGIEVELPPTMAAPGGSFSVQVCQSGRCATERGSSREVTGPFAVGAGAWMGMDRFGSRFDEGTATVTVEVIGRAGRVQARRTEDIELAWVYPNGRDCDGDYFLGGSIVLTPADRVAPDVRIRR